MKKHLKITVVLILFTILIPFNSFLVSNTEIANTDTDSLQTSQGTTLIFGTSISPQHLDPHYSWDTGSNNVINQVVEHLYQFDIEDPEYPIIPWLASTMPTISPDGLNYYISLRTGITFHDGTPFNAAAVKWNFDRLCYFLNYSGNIDLPAPFNVPLPSDVYRTQLLSIYRQDDGKRVINRTEVLSTYSVKFVLNAPKASFLSILCYVGSGILSPTSVIIQGKELDYLSYDDDDVLIGTGPFKYQDYFTDIQVNFEDNPDYWQGAPQLTDLTFAIFENLNAMSTALSTGDIDLVNTLDTSFIPQFEADPDIEIVMAGNTLHGSWIAFDYQSMSQAMRMALSWCFNYTYMIDVILEGEAVRWPTYIPYGLHYANYSLNYPTHDIARARNYLLNDPYYGPICAAEGLTAGSPDSAWINVANGPNPIATWNISWNTETQRRGDISNRLAFDAKYIGVHIDVYGMSWSELIARIVVYHHLVEMYVLAWAPDYPDPENFINFFYSNTSVVNGGDFYEPDVQQLMDEGLIETDPVAREAIYQEMQRLMVEEYVPSITLWSRNNYDAWRVNVHGWIPNHHERLYFYPVYLTPLDLTPPTWNPDDDIIPSEINIFYTRSPQIIGSIKIYGSFQISNIQLVNMDPPYNGRPDEGFSLSITYYPQDSNNLYWTDVVVMTTNLLSRGEHHLKLIFHDDQGNFAEKSFVVTVNRQAELTLSGEFDYLEKEKVKISIAAQVLDAEDKFLMIPTSSMDIIVHIRIVDYNGVTKVEDSMSYDSNGFFHWDSIFTINDLKRTFPKGIYIVQGWVEFSPESSYYMGINDIIQFHIDPPSGTEHNVWSILMVGSIGGLITLNVYLTILILRKRRGNLELIRNNKDNLGKEK